MATTRSLYRWFMREQIRHLESHFNTNKHNEAEHKAWLQSLKNHNVLWNLDAINSSLSYRHKLISLK